MYLLSLEAYVVGIIIGVVVVQYALALFCLIKLAFLDISRKQYVLWNLFILLIFFIGDIAFIIYYCKVGKNKKIPPYVRKPAEEVKPDPQEEKKDEETDEKEPADTEEDKNADTEEDKN